METVVLLVALAIVLVAVGALFLLDTTPVGGYGLPTRCPRCGLDSLETFARGADHQPTGFRCTKCGTRFRYESDGRLTNITE